MLKTILNRSVAKKLAAASIVMGVLSAHAENIKVDFGTVDAAPTAANWNTVAFNGSLSNLTDYDTGNPTSAAVSTSGWAQDINNSTNGGHGDTAHLNQTSLSRSATSRNRRCHDSGPEQTAPPFTEVCRCRALSNTVRLNSNR